MNPSNMLIPDIAHCRVCIRGDTQLVPFVQFDTDHKSYKLAEAISAVGGVRVENDDGLPQHCCVRCLREIESAYKLQQTCQESDRKLREIFRVELRLMRLTPQDVVDSIQVKNEPVEDEGEATELQQMENVAEDSESNEGASGDEPVMNLVKEEIHIDDSENGYIDEDNSMEFEETADDVVDQDDRFEKLSVEGKICCGCNELFKSKDELLVHRDTVHIDKQLTKEQLGKRVQCDICYKDFKNRSLLFSHQKVRNYGYRCKSCKETFFNQARVIRHFHIKHALYEGGECTCCACELSFNSQEELAAHSKEVHLPKRPPPDPNRPLECEICFTCFKNENGIYMHKTRFTKTAQKFQCDECSRFFRYSRQLKTHKKSNCKTRCDLCPVTETFTHKALLKHLASHRTPDNRYKCLECDKTFRRRRGLRFHGFDHTGKRPLSCPQCPSTFITTDQLTRHAKIHLNQRDQQCELCTARFLEPSNLRHHVKYYHMKAKPLLCFFCDESFGQKRDRLRHIKYCHAAELQANPELEAEIRVVNRQVGACLDSTDGRIHNPKVGTSNPEAKKTRTSRRNHATKNAKTRDS